MNANFAFNEIPGRKEEKKRESEEREDVAGKVSAENSGRAVLLNRVILTQLLLEDHQGLVPVIPSRLQRLRGAEVLPGSRHLAGNTDFSGHFRILAHLERVMHDLISP